MRTPQPLSRAQAVVIVDLQGLSLSHTSPTALRIFRLLISKFQESYPEFMVATYLINAPTIFTGLWALVRPWLDPKVTAKVHILGGEKARTSRGGSRVWLSPPAHA